MNLERLVNTACDKDYFRDIDRYCDFAKSYLEFIKGNIQAVILSRNENNYQFFQYKDDGAYNITRPINSELMYSLEEMEAVIDPFKEILLEIQSNDNGTDSSLNREIINRTIYTAQQCIGATLDALPANKSNTARKINGDLFERFIRFIVGKVGVCVTHGTVQIPVKINKKVEFTMNYQHDLIVKAFEEVCAIGSVKTSSKDRLAKIFIDKFLYNRLTDRNTPHFAIFLNDVQRKGSNGKYGVNATFLSGHFKVYTVKLNPLDGVYYFDIRSAMRTTDILKDHIKTFDHFLFDDIWKLVR